MIATKPPVVISEENTYFINSGAFARISGTNSTPNPKEILTDNTKVAFLFIF